MRQQRDLWDAWPEPTGKALRDAGMEAASDNAGEAWNRQTRNALKAFLATRDGKTFTSQDFRAWYQNEPRSPSAWGSVFNSALRAKLIEKTGEVTNARMPQSHATLLPLYRVPR